MTACREYLSMLELMGVVCVILLSRDIALCATRRSRLTPFQRALLRPLSLSLSKWTAQPEMLTMVMDGGACYDAHGSSTGPSVSQIDSPSMHGPPRGA